MKKVMFLFATAILTISCAQAYQNKNGFLILRELPDAIKFLPAPPQSGPAYDKDVEAYEWGKQLRQDPKVRAHCLHLDTLDMNTVFNEAVGFEMLSFDYHEIMGLLAGSVKDAQKVSKPAKEYFKRMKPFQVFNEASLKKNSKKALSSSTYAYPSGHAVRSWMYAFVLSDVAPEYKDSLYKCAEDYSKCRVIMGRHWQTDIDAGKMLSEKVYEKLKQSPAYQAQLELAREQYKTIKKK